MVNTSNKDAALRAQILHSMNVLDTNPEETFDRITRIASTALDMPVSLVSLLDEDRQWFNLRTAGPQETRLEDSFCQFVGDNGEILEVRDARADGRSVTIPLSPCSGDPVLCRLPPSSRWKACASAPSACSTGSPRTLLPQQRQVLKDLAAIATHELELRRIASTDALTGAWNRRMLEIVATNEFHRAQRVKRPFSLAVLDIDHFKRVNDRFGHEAGNDALFGFASTFRSVMRKEDWLFRIAARNSPPFSSARMPTPPPTRWNVSAARWRTGISPSAKARFRMTASGAVVTAADADGSPRAPLPKLLEIADKALYQAKREGRNRSSASPERAPPHRRTSAFLLSALWRHFVSVRQRAIFAFDIQRLFQLSDGPRGDPGGGFIVIPPSPATRCAPRPSSFDLYQGRTPFPNLMVRPEASDDLPSPKLRETTMPTATATSKLPKKNMDERRDAVARHLLRARPVLHCRHGEGRTPPPSSFHAMLFALASIASVFAIGTRYMDRPAELPPQTINGRPNYNMGPVKVATLLAVFWGIARLPGGRHHRPAARLPGAEFRPALDRLRAAAAAAHLRGLFAFGGNVLIASSFYVVQRTSRARLPATLRRGSWCSATISSS